MNPTCKEGVIEVARRFKWITSSQI